MVADIHESRVSSLLSRMTLEEKLGQLTMLAGTLVLTGPVEPGDAVAEIRAGRAGSFLNAFGLEELHGVQRAAVEDSRLGIPLFFCYDVLHGQRSIFPIPLGEASAFDRDLWERTAAAAAEEATADGLHLTFAPMLDVSRDARWGRMAESPGEDPFVAAEFGRAKIRGFQERNSDPRRRLVACAKHFAAYGAVLAGREYAEVDISERTLREVHFPPFRVALEAGVKAIMPAFHDLNGIPMTAHRPLLRGLLRETWGFDGLLISDYNAIAELMDHGVAADRVEAAALALNAGIDIDMMSSAYLQGLPEALDRGLVGIDDVDRSVARVLRLKSELGLFEDPYGGMKQAWSDWAKAVPHRALAREAARKSMVVLKNRDDFLPWHEHPKRLAVVDPFAALPGDHIGPWFGAGSDTDMIDIVPGLRAAWPECIVSHARGVGWRPEDTDDIADAVECTRQADAVLLCLGEESDMSGEGASRARPDLSPSQMALARAILDAGKPVVVALIGGRPIVLPDWLVDEAAAVVMLWFAGTEVGNALADILGGGHSPSGRLPVSWPAEIGQIPIHGALRPTGRPHVPGARYTTGYNDTPIAPRFVFGAGLSWTRFDLSDLAVDRPVVRAGEAVTVSVTVRNAGAMAGEDTLFLFIRDPLASVTRPILELKDFSKITLATGESRRVTFSLSSERFEFLDADLRPCLESGAIQIYVGHSAAADDHLRVDIEIAPASQKGPVWNP